ncbi:fluoride efflux transporter CrcB [Longibacter salinarum]|uniref:Fluoride-specific ion channel FluC n=1 Tax=Longibacter salinarum TaxID=1850348 RepID=A0A2A8CZQ2_9BACT|nr:fluoride efflux transporter CrcB [Longibacter salinarum]PEN14199.1 fluoride efflux transporter CrcB [Longibacter salinarum]
MRSLLLIAAGGAIGALMRHGVSALVHRYVPASFPWGTLAANLAGCFLIGALWAVSERSSFSPALGLFLFTGMIGAFTTFSTYALESLQLMQRGHVVSGLANIALSTLAGIFLVLIGMQTAKWILDTASAAAGTA